jgi:hypothetical protein
MAFYPGQIVECISDHWIFAPHRIVPIKGQRYTVITPTMGLEGTPGLVLKECPASLPDGWLNPYGWTAEYFRPVTDISQLQELLKVKELEDV